MANQRIRPVTQADYDRVQELHAQNMGRNAIARELKRSPRTISGIAAALGVTFDRTMTAVATQARVIDGKARRTAILADLYEVIQDDLTYLLDDDYELVEVSMGNPVRYTVDRLPAQDRKALISAVGNATVTVARLEAVDGQPGEDDARSMLGKMMSGLTQVWQEQQASASGDEGDDAS